MSTSPKLTAASFFPFERLQPCWTEFSLRSLPGAIRLMHWRKTEITMGPESLAASSWKTTRILVTSFTSISTALQILRDMACITSSGSSPSLEPLLPALSLLPVLDSSPSAFGCVLLTDLPREAAAAALATLSRGSRPTAVVVFLRAVLRVTRTASGSPTVMAREKLLAAAPMFDGDGCACTEVCLLKPMPPEAFFTGSRLVGVAPPARGVLTAEPISEASYVTRRRGTRSGLVPFATLRTTLLVAVEAASAMAACGCRQPGPT
mmetsp:Transcript_8962/g.19755  ORF Transcript_8962/g.19755 Transcript_8962/m.19755 type:complete len:264 (-) Transcript_8962:29-820(-)